MRVLLRFTLDCDADTAWDVVRSPAAFRQASAPLLQFESLEREGFPQQWSPGEHVVRGRLLGLVDAGTQVIRISYESRSPDVRIMRDNGGGLTGPFALIGGWRHSIAISPLPDGRTLYRDQLQFTAGLMTVPAWFGLWAFWQIRAIRIRQLTRVARGWTADHTLSVTEALPGD